MQRSSYEGDTAAIQTTARDLAALSPNCVLDQVLTIRPCAFWLRLQRKLCGGTWFSKFRDAAEQQRRRPRGVIVVAKAYLSLWLRRVHSSFCAPKV